MTMLLSGVHLLLFSQFVYEGKSLEKVAIHTTCSVDTWILSSIPSFVNSSVIFGGRVYNEMFYKDTIRIHTVKNLATPNSRSLRVHLMCAFYNR